MPEAVCKGLPKYFDITPSHVITKHTIPHPLGIQWHTLHLLDQSEYWQAPRHDYVPLPPHARTAATRVRWFQIPTQGVASVGWTLDDVHIGGSQINPSQLFERLEDEYEETMWEFSPGSSRRSGVCGLTSGALLWGATAGVKSLTTTQLIIQQDYMLQFKVSLFICV